MQGLGLAHATHLCSSPDTVQGNCRSCRRCSQVSVCTGLLLLLSQGGDSDNEDDDAKAARLEAERETRQQALNEKQAAQEAQLAGSRELMNLRLWPGDKCAATHWLPLLHVL